MQISQGKTQNFLAHKRRIYKTYIIHGWRTLSSRADSSHIRHTSYPVPVRRPLAFGLDFLQTPPHDDALVLLLAFGSATWRKDFHLVSSAPCLAHTIEISGWGEAPVHWIDLLCPISMK